MTLADTLTPASMWGAGGHRYDAFSAHFDDAIVRCVERAAPRAGEALLDVATGTGRAARHAARRGARVDGADISPALIAAAQELARDEGLSIRFHTADAVALPFTPASFDVVLSTFGVMFAQPPEAAAGELARVVRAGGRVCVAAWIPAGPLEALGREVFARYVPEAAGAAVTSPFEWGREERVSTWLGQSFTLEFERHSSPLRATDGAAVWALWASGHGPTMTILESLDDDRKARFRDDFIAFHEQFRDAGGVAMDRGFLVAHGQRA